MGNKSDEKHGSFMMTGEQASTIGQIIAEIFKQNPKRMASIIGNGNNSHLSKPVSRPPTTTVGVRG